MIRQHRILVYGAGVLGSLLAARLHTGGHNVAILARGQRLADIREHGIVLEDYHTGQRETVPVPAVESLEPDDAYDLVLVVMQQQQTADVLPALAANRRTPSLLFLQNNPHGPSDLIEALGPGRVLLGFPASGGGRSLAQQLLDEGQSLRPLGAAAVRGLARGRLRGGPWAGSGAPGMDPRMMPPATPCDPPLD